MPRRRLTPPPRAASLGLALVLLAWAASAGAAPPRGSLTLSEAYRMALRQSEQVAVAMANRDVADVQHTGALTLMGPTLGLQASGFYRTQQPFIGAPAAIFNGGELDVNASQPLFRRQIFDARRATALATGGAEQNLKRARQQLMFDVATAFITVMRNRQQIVIAEGAVKRAETQLQNATQRFKAGAALKTAELLAQIDLNRAQVQVNTAVGGLRQADSVFERLMGVPPPETLVLPRTPVTTADRDLIDSSRSARPDVRALRLITEQQEAIISQLQGKLFWPTLDVVFAGSLQMFPSGSIPSYGVGGNLTVPLFQTGDEWVQVKLQRAKVRLAAANESLLRRQVGDDVRQAVARIEIARNAIEIANEQLKYSNQNYTMVTVQYKNGAATVLELVTAQGAVFEAETNKSLALYDVELATYQLLLAEGKIDL